MINEHIRYRISADRKDAFFASYEKGQAGLRASPHCLGYELSRCIEDRDQFILRIQWDSEEGHIQGLRTSLEFQPFYQAVSPFMKSIEEMRHYEVTSLAWRR